MVEWGFARQLLLRG